ncbi:uncharacterized protein LOC141674807 [Apium graveolens]|uniref:uncharacterized protein LOC141674807 n=1 Tax=Apium graveolens TaxID=4045 RepID=UPI003D78C024
MDKKALAVIYQGIPKEILLALAEKKMSKDAWNTIKIMSLGADKVKASKSHTLKGEFKASSMKENESLDDFYLKLHGLVRNIWALEEMSVEEAVGSLKAHEERVRGQTDTGADQGQLLFTEEEWKQRENQEGKVLLTPEEWKKRNNKGGNEYKGKEPARGICDRSKVRCFNCQGLGHFAVECRKPRRDREMGKEVNLSQIQGDEPALLVAEIENKEKVSMLVNEGNVFPKL